jgi:hypothetical protein
MNNEDRIIESIRAILIRSEEETLYFNGLEDDNSYAVPISCLVTNDITPGSEYLLSYFVKNKEIKPDGTRYIQKGEVISRESLNNIRLDS